MNAEGASPVHTDSTRSKAPRPSSSRRPSRGGVASAASVVAGANAMRNAFKKGTRVAESRTGTIAPYRRPQR